MTTIILHRLKNHAAPLGALLAIPMLSLFYGLLNNGGRGAQLLVTELDRATPFLKIFIIPYLLWYPFILAVLVYLCVKDRRLYFQTLAAYCVGLIVCYVVYYFYQTTVPRPIVSGNDVFSQLVRMTFASDQPFNCFPSIHVLTSYLMMLAVGTSPLIGRRVKIGVGAFSATIILSTLLVKQHVILDVVGAVMLADTVFFAASAASPVFERRYQAYREKWLWRKRPYSLSTMRRKS